MPTYRISLPRQSWVVLHRWAGLTITLFLVITGFTGSMLVWNQELTRALSPQLSAAVPPNAGARPLDGLTLTERVVAQTGATITDIPFEIDPHHVASFWVTSPPGVPAYDTLWADPYTGKVRLTFRDGNPADGRPAIMSFLFRIHMTLALGEFGRIVLGLAALIWTLDCFVGFYLTLPVRQRGGARRPAASWWSRWRPAWLIRRRAGRHKVTFDLHRAGGLWLWPVLLVFAWSSVIFNLPEVAKPVMRAFGQQESFYPKPIATPLPVPPIGVRDAVLHGRALLEAVGRREGFVIGDSTELRYMPDHAAYRYAAAGSGDLIGGGGHTVYFRATDGRMMAYLPPTPPDTAGAVSLWLVMLHVAGIFGLPYRIFVTALGLLVVGLSVTGVLIWMKKRTARILGKKRAPRPSQASRLGLIAAK